MHTVRAKGGFSETRRSKQRERTREDQTFKMDTISRKNYNLTIMCTSPDNVRAAACIYVHVSVLEINPVWQVHMATSLITLRD